MSGASSSSSSNPKSFKYDVFLSFRGDDTRKNFLGLLYKALDAKCIETYKDDEKIQQGERINDELIKAIQDSKFFIIVFSKTYASSSWCLDELVKIMECQKTAEQNAYPVFFDVEPTHVRKQIGPVGEAFSRHENHEAAEKWRVAMRELADLAGWELKATANGDESKSIEIIVDAIFRKLHSTHSIANENLVGMETRISDVLSSLDISAEDVRMIGIKGIGGGGKTTLARTVYDRISDHFEGKSFVENVRAVSNPSSSGLKKLQKKILKDVSSKQDISFSSVHDGKTMLKAMMRRRKILVVLDDVDRVEQLDALVGKPDDSFKPGSRIIITTRDEQVLLAHGVNLVHDVNLLSSTEAICLFNRYAFPNAIPIRGYEKLSRQVVRYAAGLPLTVKVFGSFLFGKNMVEWEDAIERLKRIPFKDTLEKLELSYISLENDYKEMFLDIACILKGESKKDAIRILESLGFHARNGLKVLQQRSLITISKEEVLGMRDQIEEMGKNIVRREHPDEPNKHSRLWIREEIQEILANDMGTEETRCLKLDRVFGWQDIKETRFHMKGLRKMKKLRYLELDFYDYKSTVKCLDDISQCFSNSLKYLKCTHYPFLCLPKTFQANNLVGLEMEDMENPMVQLWEEGEKKVLKKLKFLSLHVFYFATNMDIIDECYTLNDIPNHKLNYIDIGKSELRAFDLGLTPSIETLSLIGSHNLGELYMPVSCQKLKHLVIGGSKLRTFNLGLTPNLETLSLFDCADFVELHVSLVCPNLKFLDICGSSLRSLDLELIPNLETLVLENCHQLVEINAPVGCMKNVGYFKLNCWRFDNIKFGGACEPKVVSRSSASFLNLEVVSPDLACPLHPSSNLPKLWFPSSNEELLTSSVGYIEKLLSFGLCLCTDFKKISDMICSLRCLKKLKLKCNKFPKDLGQLECLEELLLSSSKIKHLPDSICMLKHLKVLKVENSEPDLMNLNLWNNGGLLEKLPEDLGRLECLEKLHVSRHEIAFLPDSICMLKRLKWLYVTDCRRIGKLPEDIGQLESLKRLVLSYSAIEHLPDSVCMLKHLKYLYLDKCDCLEKFPEDLGRLECLKEIDITWTGVRHLPQSIVGLKGLRIAASPKLLQLYDFPSERLATDWFTRKRKLAISVQRDAERDWF